MNQKSLIIILAVIIVIFAGTAIFFAVFKKTASLVTNQPTENLKDNTTTATPTQAVEGETSVNNENWKNTPAEIKELYTKNNTTYLSIDILSFNPNFLPGENDFFINQNNKLREVKIDNDTEFYKCGPGPDNIDTTADINSSVEDLLTYIQQKITKKDRPVIYYFDITDSVVKNIYEQCLP